MFAVVFNFFLNDLCEPFSTVTFLGTFFLFFLCRPYTTYKYLYQHRYFHAGIFVCIPLLIGRIPSTCCVECQKNRWNVWTWFATLGHRRSSGMCISYVRPNGACTRFWGEGNTRRSHVLWVSVLLLCQFPWCSPCMEVLYNNYKHFWWVNGACKSPFACLRFLPTSAGIRWILLGNCVSVFCVL
jgi:hypothetical protein